MKKKIIALSITVVVLIICIYRIAARIDKEETPRSFEPSTAPGIEWIKVEKDLEKYDYSYYGGTWMTLEDVLKVSEKGINLTGRDLWKYNFYEDLTESYQRIYPIADLDMLFELRVGWDIDKKERFSMAKDPVDELTASVAILIAKNGLNTQVDFLNGDVEAYIEEQQDNPAYNTFTFAYYPIEVEGTSETIEKFASLWEERETYIISNTDVSTGIKLDNIDEMYTFSEVMQNELKYTDKAIPENVFLKLGLNLDKRNAEPTFLLYLSAGNTANKYSVSKVEKHGKDLHISIKSEARSNQDVIMDGCLIGLQIVKDGSEPSTIRDVTTIHIDVVD